MGDEKKWWQHDAALLSEELKTDVSAGLSEEEAKRRLAEHGLNQLPEVRGTSLIVLVLRQFSSFIVWLLIVAAVIAGLMGQWIDDIAILVIILLNGIIGFVQEYNAERSMAALRKLSNTLSKVIRGGKLQTVPSSELVVGDLVLLEAGDRIPADGRFVTSTQLAAQEAALTGESLPIHKEIHPIDEEKLSLCERKNMGFMGTVVVSGKGHILVTDTALGSELGKIAELLKASTEEQTPLQIRLKKLGHWLVGLCLVIVAAVFVLGMFRGMPFIDMVLTALSLAVAAVPEGLPAVVTIALAVGVQKMVRKKALIRRLPSVETLGCASVICSDKTGTLTQNEMVVRTLWVDGSFYDVTGIGYLPVGEFQQEHQTVDLRKVPELLFALQIGAVCNSAALSETDGKWEVTGDPTEGALLVAAKKARLQEKELSREFPVVGEIPFDSERKRMSVLVKTLGGVQLFVKGAPDVVIKRCSKWHHKGGHIFLTEEKREGVLETNDRLARGGLRVLALAYRPVQVDESISEELEEDLVFLGLVAMMDPPRIGVKEAIQTCRRAGIRPVMITGDHKETAIAVGREIGLMQEDDLAINGEELEEMDDEALKEIVPKTALFARVSAKHKFRIVKAWKEIGETVAVTGDGVNDAPAIKEGDIGVAMGITGTDVTKEASDMVVLDDNFASIVHAVEEGRGIYDNILKFVNYLLSSNIAELLIIFIGLAVGFTDVQGNTVIPLTAVQLLWLNLVTDGMPAIALGLDPVDPTAMQRPPRKKNEPIISWRLGSQMSCISILIAAGALIACLFGLRTSGALAQTMTLTTLVVLELVRVQMVRAQYHTGLFANLWVVCALLSSFIMQLVITYTPPLQVVFGTTPLSLVDWGLIVIIAACVWLIGSAVNWCFRSNSPASERMIPHL